MFIVRTVFWLSLVVLILPTDARQQELMTSKVISTVQHITTFCDRNEKICENGAHYWGVFRQKADYGFQLAISLVTERLSGEETDSKATLQRSSNSTLRPADLSPAWRGKSAQDRL